MVFLPDLLAAVSTGTFGISALAFVRSWQRGVRAQADTISARVTEVTSLRPFTDRGPRTVGIGVAAVSATGACAVGDYSNSANAGETLVEHWNGAAWKQVPSPNPSSASNILNGVGASSATDIWAVGEYYNSAGRGRVFALHCC